MRDVALQECLIKKPGPDRKFRKHPPMMMDAYMRTQGQVQAEGTARAKAWWE